MVIYNLIEEIKIDHGKIEIRNLEPDLNKKCQLCGSTEQLKDFQIYQESCGNYINSCIGGIFCKNCLENIINRKIK